MEARLDRRRFLGAAAIGAGAALTLPAAARARGGATVLPADLRSFGVVADGRTDDAAALGRALRAAKRSGGLVLARRGTLLLRSTVVVPDGIVVDFGGSTLRKAPELQGPALLVRGSGVRLSRLTLDGNRAGGARGAGIEWHGSAGVLQDAVLRSTEVAGLSARSQGADVQCVRVASGDHVSGQKSGDGFYAAFGGRIRLTSGCSAADNDRAGIYLETSAADGCVVNGAFDRNGVCGAYLKSPKGTSTLLRTTANERFGVIMKQFASGWRFGTVEVTGDPASTELSATGIELYGSAGCTFRNVVVRGMTGYAVALAKGDLPGGVGASGNTFFNIDADGSNTRDSDPGLHLSGGSKSNRFGRLRVRGHTVAISFGEGFPPLDNDSNQFGVVRAESCPYGAVIIRGGSGNFIDRLEAVGCGTIDPTIGRGLVVWGPTATTENTIKVLDVSGGTPFGQPFYLVVAEGGARGNRVLGGRGGPTRSGIALDPAGANPVAVA